MELEDRVGRFDQSVCLVSGRFPARGQMIYEVGILSGRKVELQLEDGVWKVEFGTGELEECRWKNGMRRIGLE